MRRKDRQCDELAFMAYVLDNAETLFLAFHDGAFPYVLPFNFVARDNKIYLHSAREGHKIDLISANNHVAFSACLDPVIDQARFTTYYKSVCGKGMAFLVEDAAEKAAALAMLAEKYRALCKIPTPRAVIEKLAIIRIDIVVLTGKKNEPRA